MNSGLKTLGMVATSALNLVPGQQAWQNSLANYQAGNYGHAAAHLGAMVAEQVLTVATFGAGSGASVAGRASSTAVTAASVEAAAAKAARNEVTVYRVFGGDARAQGFSWTTRDPRIVTNFRDVAGLPSGGASRATNTADFLVKGKVNAADIIKSRSALPLDGNKGGLEELIINPKNVNITDFSVLNP